MLGRDLTVHCSAVYIKDEMTTTNPGSQAPENVILTYQWEFNNQPVEVFIIYHYTINYLHKIDIYIVDRSGISVLLQRYPSCRFRLMLTHTCFYRYRFRGPYSLQIIHFLCQK